MMSKDEQSTLGSTPEFATQSTATFPDPSQPQEGDSEKNAAHIQVNSVSSVEGQDKSAPLPDKSEEDMDDMDRDWEVDPENPRNWCSRRKWTATAIGSLHAFCPILASTMMAPGLPNVAIKYSITNPTVVALTLSIFLLSYGIGPLVFGPLTEIYGRRWVLHVTNLFTTAFGFGCAFSPNTGTLVAFRLLSGFTGGASVAVGGGLVPDLFDENDRGPPTALFVLGMLVGPVAGPIAGGFITQQIGIKYVFIVIAALCGVASLIGIPLLRETYAPILRMRLAARSGDLEALKKIKYSLRHTQESKLKFLWTSLSRPVILLFRSLICFMLSLYMALQFGIYYLMFTTFGEFFHETYGFDTGIGGLTFLGLGVGFSVAIVGAKFADGVYKKLALKNGGVGKPEMRIPAMFFGSLFVPVGVFWYGWSAQAKLHWIMPIIGSAIFSFGMMTTTLPIQLYLTDTFTYAASATAASTLFRSMFGFAFPLFGVQMIDAMGEGGGFSLMAGLSIVVGIPFPVWLYYRGEQMRSRNPLTVESTKKIRPLSVVSATAESPTTKEMST